MKFSGKIAINAIPLLDYKTVGNSCLKSNYMGVIKYGFKLLDKYEKIKSEFDEDLGVWIIKIKKWYFWGIINYEIELAVKTPIRGLDDGWMVTRLFNNGEIQWFVKSAEKC